MHRHYEDGDPYAAHERSRFPVRQWVWGTLALLGMAGLVYFMMPTPLPDVPVLEQVAALNIPTPLWNGYNATPAPASAETPVAPPRNELTEQLALLTKELRADREAQRLRDEAQRQRDAKQDAALEEIRKRPQPAAVASSPAEKPKPLSWTVPTLTVGKPLFERPEQPETVAQLIHKAVHEIPERPERVLYRSQSIPGATMDEIRPDIPGQIRILVTQPVMDKWQQQTLIPQHSYVIGQQLDVPEYGESRLAIGVEQIELPSGEVIQLKSQVADQRGAMGLQTKVSGNWGRIIAASLISGMLSVGTMIPAGNPDNYHLTIPQEIARQTGSAINQAGQQVVQRELHVRKFKPIPAGTPTELHILENVSLADPPIVAR